MITILSIISTIAYLSIQEEIATHSKDNIKEQNCITEHKLWKQDNCYSKFEYCNIITINPKTLEICLNQTNL
jgi:hypothetical protein